METYWFGLLAVIAVVLLVLLGISLRHEIHRPKWRSERPLFPHDPAVEGRPFERSLV